MRNFNIIEKEESLDMVRGAGIATDRFNTPRDYADCLCQALDDVEYLVFKDEDEKANFVSIATEMFVAVTKAQR
jgi:hypothetical protein